VPVVPLATGVSALLYTYALQRGTLLTLVPATERIGTRQALDDLDAGVVVTDGRRVVEANTAACRMLDRSPGSLVGVTPEAALSALDTSPAELPAVVEHDNRFYDVSTSPVTDDGGDRVGRTLLLTDVTDRRRRRQRLDVLNRVLRHNIRNKLTVVTGRTRDTAQRVGDETLAGWLADATAAAEDLLATSRKARAVEEAMRGATDPTTVSLAPAVAAAVDRLDVDPARVDVRVDPGVTVRTDAELLVLALAELVENAVEHGVPGADDPPATVTARETTTGVAVTVADDGPGIPASELAPLDAGGETQLEHASGLGLWLVDWATARLGGDVRFETDDGTRVVLSVPDAEAVSSPATTGPARVPEQGD
jgi:signal transduction histidine kinase